MLSTRLEKLEGDTLEGSDLPEGFVKTLQCISLLQPSPGVDCTNQTIPAMPLSNLLTLVFHLHISIVQRNHG